MSKILGIEIGLTGMKVVVMDAGKKQARPHRCFTVRLPDGLVDDGRVKDPEAVGALLLQRLKKENITAKRAIFLAVSGRIAHREVMVPYVKDSNIRHLVEANGREYFPVDLAQYRVSYVKTGVLQTEDAKQLRLLVVAAPKNLLQAYEETAKAAGLTVAAIDYVGNSLFQKVAKQGEKGVRMFLKVEDGHTLVLIIKNGEVSLLRNINYGISEAADYLKEAFPEKKLDRGKAIALMEKERYLNPSFDPGEEEEDPIRKKATESLHYLCGILVRIVDYYLAGNRGTEIDSITLVGGACRVKGLRELLSFEIGMDISVLGTPEDGKEPKEGVYLAAAGAALLPMQLKEKKKGLFFAFRKENGEGGKDSSSLLDIYRVLAVSITCSLLLMGAGFGIRVYRQMQQKSLKRQIRALEPIEQLRGEYKGALAAYENLTGLYEYTKTPGDSLLLFFGEMEQKMPRGISIASFQTAGDMVTMDIVAGSKAEAARALMQLRTFEGVSDVSTTGIKEEEDGTVNLSVSCMYQYGGKDYDEQQR